MSFRDLDRGAQPVLDRLSEGLANVAAVGEHVGNAREIGRGPRQRLQRSFAIRDLGRRHGDGVRQALRIHGNMPFDARDFLITFVRCAIGVLHALRVHDQERRADVVPLFHAGRANLIFNARSRTLIPFGSASLHFAKYECTVRHFGKSCGNIRH